MALIKNTINLLCYLLFIVIISCVTPTKESLYPQMELVEFPTEKTINAVKVGDLLVSKAKIYTYNALELKNQVQSSGGMIFKPGTLIARAEDNKWIYYFSDKKMLTRCSLHGYHEHSGGLAVSKTENNNLKIFTLPEYYKFRTKAKPDYISKTVYAMDKTGFVQELIYNGKSNNIVEFLYKYEQLSNDTNNVPFIKEVEYNLNEGNIIGFKGLRIEIIEATNAYIRYKLISSFSDIP